MIHKDMMFNGINNKLYNEFIILNLLYIKLLDYLKNN